MLDDETRRKRRLTTAQWLEIVALAKTGVPTKDICERFSISKTAFYRGLEQRGYSRSTLKKAQAEYTAEQEHQELIAKIKETKKNAYQRVEAMERMAVSLVGKQAQRGLPISDALPDVKTIERVMNIVTRGTTAKWKILGLDDVNKNTDETIPELVVRELTQEEVIHIRDEQRKSSSDITEEELKLLQGADTSFDYDESEGASLDEIVTEELEHE